MIVDLEVMISAMCIVDLAKTVEEGTIFDINEALGISKKYPESRTIIQKDNDVATLYFYNDDGSYSCEIPEMIEDEEGVIKLAQFFDRVIILMTIDQLRKSL